MFTKRSTDADMVTDSANEVPQQLPADASPRPTVARPVPKTMASSTVTRPASSAATPAPAPTMITPRPAPPATASAQAAPRSTVSRTAETSETGRLHVGREIKLKGEIGQCERLVVEGSVEAALMDCRSMEIAPGGFFSGQAKVDTAEISGHFEGELTVEGLLTVTSTGRLSGTIGFGELQVERGGTISGEIEFAGAMTK